MASQPTDETLEALVETRRRVDELSVELKASQDSAEVARQLDGLADGLPMIPSVAALLYGAGELIRRGDPADRRLEKLSDHLHGYMVGWEDATAVRDS